MVKKGMKVGDVFKDGKRTYKVLEVIPGGYNCQFLGEELPEEEKKREEELTKEMLEKMTVKQLQEIANEMSLDFKGKKAELIERIAEQIKEQ